MARTTRITITSPICMSGSTTTSTTFRKEITCSGDSEILQEIVRDTTRISSCFSDLHLVLRAISFSISESPLHFIFLNSAPPAGFFVKEQCQKQCCGDAETRAAPEPELIFWSVWAKSRSRPNLAGAGSEISDFRSWSCPKKWRHQQHWSQNWAINVKTVPRYWMFECWPYWR